MKKEIGEGGAAFALWKDARDKKNQVNNESTDMAISQGKVITKMHSLNAVQVKMSAGVLAAKANASPEKQKELDAIVNKNVTG